MYLVFRLRRFLPINLILKININSGDHAVHSHIYFLIINFLLFLKLCRMMICNILAYSESACSIYVFLLNKLMSLKTKEKSRFISFRNERELN